MAALQASSTVNAAAHSALDADAYLRNLALVVARNAVGANDPLPTVLSQQGIAQSEYDAVKDNPVFTRYVDAFTRELRDSGFSFSAKCRVLAEDVLSDLYHIVKDPETPAAARVKGIENLVTWGDLKPKELSQLSAGTGFSISITIGADQLVSLAQKPTIDAQIIESATIGLPTAPPSPAELVLTPSAEPRTPKIVIEEPEDYEYAGDDVIL